jgi:hypothetical protein
VLVLEEEEEEEEEEEVEEEESKSAVEAGGEIKLVVELVEWALWRKAAAEGGLCHVEMRGAARDCPSSSCCCCCCV